MNIRAVMAVLMLDLGRAEKHALLVLACRADQHDGMVRRVSVRRVAKDMGASYPTAWAALNRLVDAGYVNVDKSPGLTPLWMLTPKVALGVPIKNGDSTPKATLEDPSSGFRTKESLEKTKERGSHFASGSGLIVDFTSRRKVEGDG